MAAREAWPALAGGGAFGVAHPPPEIVDRSVAPLLAILAEERCHLCSQARSDDPVVLLRRGEAVEMRGAAPLGKLVPPPRVVVLEHLAEHRRPVVDRARVKVHDDDVAQLEE